MIKKPFFGLKKQGFEYEALKGDKVELQKISTPESLTFLIERKNGDGLDIFPKQGESVKAGEKIVLGGEGAYAVSSAAGLISKVSPFPGDFGQRYAAVTVKTGDEQAEDETFASLSGDLNMRNVIDYFAYLPGKPDVKALADSERPISTIVVLGTDADLLMTTNQYVVQHETDALNTGVSFLKQVSGVAHVVIALPQYLMKKAGAIGGASGVEIRVVDTAYPSASPYFIAKNVLGRETPAGQSFEDIGVFFIKAEAVAAIGKAVISGRPPVKKIVGLVKKDNSRVMVETLIGTPLEDIFQACGVTVNDRDRIIIGGPLTGSAVFDLRQPVLPDTDSIMIQDAGDISPVSDYPCINCGECVRICPTKTPVNMLVRFCEAGQYEDAADLYDLYSCIECGLCSFVCVSRMPVFQYIRLAKYELEKIKEAELSAEESDE